jgi:hypothetical protein
MFQHSVIPGGVRDAAELTKAINDDPVVARHYRDVNVAAVRRATLSADRHAYVSYRRGDRVYWTKNTVRIPAGEAVLTDGTNEIRGRCGNRISFDPLLPIAQDEPAAAEFDALLPEPEARVAGPNVPDPESGAPSELWLALPTAPGSGSEPFNGPPSLNARSSIVIPSSGGGGGGGAGGGRGGGGSSRGSSTPSASGGRGSDSSTSGSNAGDGGRGGGGGGTEPPGFNPNPPGGVPPEDPPGPDNDPPRGDDPRPDPTPPGFDYEDDPPIRDGDPPRTNVPEPGTLLLLGAGLSLGARYLRKRHRP